MSASSGGRPWQLGSGDDGGLRNFGYVIDGKLAGLAHPGYGGGLDAALDSLRSRGITGLVSLDEVGVAADAASEHGLAHRHIPINDFEPPTLAQADAFVWFVDDQLEQGGQVAAHCQAGIGRTGTMLAAYFIAHGSSVDEAIDAVRRRRPHSVESDSQRTFLQDYARHCQGRRG